MQTVTAALAAGELALAPIGDEAYADVRTLLAQVLQCPREWLFAHHEAPLTAEQQRDFQRLCAHRAAGRPLAYVIGSAWFYGRAFVVNEHVLVPRPETEHLVDEAVTHLNARAGAVSALDVGTGSGAIACSIAAEVRSAIAVGTDISRDAIELARLNAGRFELTSRCSFEVGDLSAPVGSARFDVVVANLPYIPTADVPARPNAVGFEPRHAVDGGVDGLVHYRRFVPDATRLLRPGGMLLLEGAPPVMDGLRALASGAFPAAEVSIHKDYAARARYVRVRT
jgi:release factor glutamine methyltransferase